MAGGAQPGGGRHWLAEEEPDFRARVLQKLASRLAQLFKDKFAPYSHELQSFVAKFEEGAFRGANSKEEYMRNLSKKFMSVEQRRQQEQERLMQMGRQMQPANAVQVIQGGKSSVTVMPLVARMASPMRPSSQPMTPQTSGLVPNQHMVYPYTPNIQTEVKQERPDMMAMLDQFLNFQTTAFTPVAPAVQPGQRSVQSVATLSHNKHPAGQLQPANFTGCNLVAKLQGQPVVRPNSQQNNLLSQNASSIGMQQLMRMNQQSLRVNQQEMDRKRYQMLGAQQANVAKTQIGRSGGRNNQQNAGWTDALQPPLKACKPEPMTPPQQQITGGHQSSLLCQSRQILATMGSTGDVDLMEKMFQQIKSWKDAYLLEFIELDRRFAVPELTEEQLRSLPREKADKCRDIVNIKKIIRKTLNFLQLQKSNVHEGLKEELPKYKMLIQYLVGVVGKTKARNAKMNTGYQSQNCHEQPQIINLTGSAAAITGCQSRQQQQQEQPADASILQSRQTIVTRTPPALQQNHSNHLLGLASPSFPISSPGALQSLPTNELECLNPSPIAKSGVVPVASPCASVKSTLTSPVAKPAVVLVASPCASVKSTLSEDGDSISAFLMHDNTSAAPPPPHGSNQATPTKPTMSASPLLADTEAGQAQDQVRGGAETPVAKKPIDRLVDAVRSSSPAALRSSVNSIWSVLSMSDIVPHGKISTFLDYTFSQQQGGSNTVNKMKRVFDHTTSRSESPPLGSMDGSFVTFECDASDSGSSSERSVKRQKTQNADDALLEEIEAINSTLIDTVISMTCDCGTDGITSCDGGTTIKLSYNAVSLSPGLKSLFGTSEMSLVMPAKLFIPAGYPSSSPVLVDDKGDDMLRKKFSAISGTVDVAFRRDLHDLPEPRSIKETARAWDACVRRTVTEFAHQHGGGTISSRLSQWERCASA